MRKIEAMKVLVDFCYLGRLMETQFGPFPADGVQPTLARFCAKFSPR